MIASLGQQGGSRFPQMRTLSASIPQRLAVRSAGVLTLYGDFLHGRLVIQPALRGRIQVKLALRGTLGINP